MRISSPGRNATPEVVCRVEDVLSTFRVGKRRFAPQLSIALFATLSRRCEPSLRSKYCTRTRYSPGAPFQGSVAVQTVDAAHTIALPPEAASQGVTLFTSYP